jgi:hypothetical protein
MPNIHNLWHYSSQFNYFAMLAFPLHFQPVLSSGPDAIVAGLSRKQGSSTVMSPILSPVPASAGSSSSKPVVIDLTDLDSDDESSRPQKDCTSPLLTNFHSTLPPPYPPVMTSPQFSLQSTVYSSIPFLEEGPSQTVAGGGHSCFSLFDVSRSVVLGTVLLVTE